MVIQVVDSGQKRNRSKVPFRFRARTVTIQAMLAQVKRSRRSTILQVRTSHNKHRSSSSSSHSQRQRHNLSASRYHLIAASNCVLIRYNHQQDHKATTIVQALPLFRVCPLEVLINVEEAFLLSIHILQQTPSQRQSVPLAKIARTQIASSQWIINACHQWSTQVATTTRMSSKRRSLRILQQCHRLAFCTHLIPTTRIHILHSLLLRKMLLAWHSLIQLRIVAHPPRRRRCWLEIPSIQPTASLPTSANVAMLPAGASTTAPIQTTASPEKIVNVSSATS